MNEWPLTLAIAAVRGWTWLYTLPLDRAVQEARRAEIESDLWEFGHDGSRPGSGGLCAAHVLIRAVLGIPDDLSWGCEQLQVQRLSVRHLWVAVRIAVLGLFASTIAVSASAPAVNLTNVLRLNVVSTGWMPVSSSRPDATVVPSLSFTFTNVADRPLGALQVNALFYEFGQRGYSFCGAAFLYAVGSRGLASGATSRSLTVQAQGHVQAADVLGPRAILQSSALGQIRVKLFVKHQGHWTLLGDYAVQSQLLRPSS